MHACLPSCAGHETTLDENARIESHLELIRSSAEHIGGEQREVIAQKLVRGRPFEDEWEFKKRTKKAGKQ